MDEILKGARAMKGLQPGAKDQKDGKAMIEALEEELRRTRESYEKLAEVHRKTWKGVVELVLDGETAGTE